MSALTSRRSLAALARVHHKVVGRVSSRTPDGQVVVSSNGATAAQPGGAPPVPPGGFLPDVYVADRGAPASPTRPPQTSPGWSRSRIGGRLDVVS